MRIALDARTIYRSIRRGTGRNLIDLYSHLAQHRPQWRVQAFHRTPEPVAALLPAPQVEPRLIEMPGDRFDAWERVRLPMAAWRAGVDLLHCPANTCPTWMPVRTLVTIHDLIPLDMPEGRPQREVDRFEQCIAHACAQAAHLITPSRYTADRLVDEFGADADRITVNAWAPDHSMKLESPARQSEIRARYDLNDPFVLHLGAGAPRKNTRRVIEAFAMLPRARRRNWKLVVVGLDEASKAEQQRRVRNLAMEHCIRLHGFAPDAELPALFSAAEVLAYPSLSEGFGLPILDAWATRTAVLTSRGTSLPEVAGNAAVLVDPTDRHVIANALSRLMLDPVLRQELVEAGAKRLPQYHWGATVERFIDAAQRALGRHQRKQDQETPLRMAA